MKKFIWQYIDIDSKSILDIQEMYNNKINGKIPPHFFQHLDLGITHFLNLEIIKIIQIELLYFIAITSKNMNY